MNPLPLDPTPHRGFREPAERILDDLEREHLALSQRLQSVETRLRELRTAETVCPHCGGSGIRPIRGGLYGERQPAACECQTGAG